MKLRCLVKEKVVRVLSLHDNLSNTQPFSLSLSLSRVQVTIDVLSVVLLNNYCINYLQLLITLIVAHYHFFLSLFLLFLCLNFSISFFPYLHYFFLSFSSMSIFLLCHCFTICLFVSLSLLSPIYSLVRSFFLSNIFFLYLCLSVCSYLPCAK